MASFEFEEAFSEVEKQFEIDSLLPEQKRGIRAFFEHKNVFVNLPTGFGKSLIFQCLPLVFDVVHGKPRCSSVIFVISPLVSLMNDQVTKLLNLGIPAINMANVTSDPELIQQVINGLYCVVYCSPESLMSPTGRDILTQLTSEEKLIGIAIDEAHCISHWGLSSNKHKAAFRKWYGCLGELRSLLPVNCPMLILTATATNFTKKEILHSLNLQLSQVFLIEQSPNKKNLFYNKLYMDKNEPLVNQFGALLDELRSSSIRTNRTIIYCQTRKQCSVIYRLFEIHLGKIMYNGQRCPKHQIVQMFHSGSPQQVKDFICNNMAQEDGHIRVLISTIAFGMGMDCKSVRRIIHFGASKTVESYVQECGRAGRDGKPSTCILLYNGLTSVHCDNAMKGYMETEDCLRRELMSYFGSSHDQVCEDPHACCSNCAKKSCEECADPIWTPYKEPDVEINLPTRTRQVSSEDKKLLRQKLINVQRENLKLVNLNHVVGCPNILFEFNLFHINQVVENCHRIFTLQDVQRFIEIWRMSYAVLILSAITEVFADIDFDPNNYDLGNGMMDITSYSEWTQICNDSTLHELIDTTDLEDISSLINSGGSFT